MQLLSSRSPCSCGSRASNPGDTTSGSASLPWPAVWTTAPPAREPARPSSRLPRWPTSRTWCSGAREAPHVSAHTGHARPAHRQGLRLGHHQGKARPSARLASATQARLSAQTNRRRPCGGTRPLKLQWLYLNSRDSIERLRVLVAFCVEEHNTQMSHSAFSGQTPDELYFSIALDDRPLGRQLTRGHLSDDLGGRAMTRKGGSNGLRARATCRLLPRPFRTKMPSGGV